LVIQYFHPSPCKASDSAMRGRRILRFHSADGSFALSTLRDNAIKLRADTSVRPNTQRLNLMALTLTLRELASSRRGR